MVGPELKCSVPFSGLVRFEKSGVGTLPELPNRFRNGFRADSTADLPRPFSHLTGQDVAELIGLMQR